MKHGLRGWHSSFPAGTKMTKAIIRRVFAAAGIALALQAGARDADKDGLVAGRDYYSVQLMSAPTGAALQKSLALVAGIPYARIDRRGTGHALRVGYWDSQPEALQAAKALLPTFPGAFVRTARFRPDSIVARAASPVTAAAAPAVSASAFPPEVASAREEKPAAAAATVRPGPEKDSARVAEQKPGAPALQVQGSSTAPAPPTTPTQTTESAQVELLRSQLVARQAINEQLSRRVEALERQLAAQSKLEGPLILGLDANAPKPLAAVARADAITAIEESLGAKGLVLLPAGSLRGSLNTSWAHNGTGASRADSYVAGATLETGLPWGMALAASVPYVWRDDASGANRGAGDPAISLARKISDGTDTLPSIVARLSYTHDGGKEPFAPLATGSGFRSYGVSFSGVMRRDPVVLYGNIFYARASAKTALLSLDDRGSAPVLARITPGDSYGFGLGASLTATPEIALDAGVSLSFAQSSRLDALGASLYPGRATAGYVNLGTSFLLTRNVSLSLSASAGVTKDASDFAFSVGLPYRFR
jgi:hypothetical protein